MAQRALQMKPDHLQARTLLGWIELTSKGGGGGGGDDEDDWDDDDMGASNPGAGVDAERARHGWPLQWPPLLTLLPPHVQCSSQL